MCVSFHAARVLLQSISSLKITNKVFLLQTFGYIFPTKHLLGCSVGCNQKKKKKKITFKEILESCGFPLFLVLCYESFPFHYIPLCVSNAGLMNQLTFLLYVRAAKICSRKSFHEGFPKQGGGGGEKKA